MDEKTEDIETSENNDENADSKNSEDLETVKKEKEELEGKNKQLYERTKKAEAEAKELREKSSEKPEETKSKDIDNQPSNEPDYAKLGFLEQRGVEHPDDQKIVQDEADRLKLPLTDVLQMEHIKSQLKTQKDERDVKENTPTGNRKGSSKSQQDVDYWVDKKDKSGTYQTPDNLELAEKVIDARMKKQVEDNKFDPIRM